MYGTINVRLSLRETLKIILLPPAQIGTSIEKLLCGIKGKIAHIICNLEAFTLFFLIQRKEAGKQA